jgi:G3E family GTPase
MATVYETRHGDVDLDRVLGIRAFDLDAKAEAIPDFLLEELPFEWAGLYRLEPGTYTLRLAPGPDPTIDLVLGGPGAEEAEVYDAWKREGILLYSDAPAPHGGEALTPGEQLYRLTVDASAGCTQTMQISEAGTYALFTQHLPEEFDLRLEGANGAPVSPVAERRYANPHEHDESVGSVGLWVPGDLDPQRFESWVVQLLRRRGTDIFRMKGVLSLKDDPKRFVFQGVHMLFDGQAGRPWEGDPRHNQLVFIGRDLDRGELEQGLKACLA